MATWRVNNSTALGGEICAPWQANHAYALGARCVCTTGYGTVAARAVVFECTTAGTSGGTQPTWDYTVGNTTTDGEVTWTCRSPSDGSWDNASCYLYYMTNHAAADGDTIYVDDGHSESSNTNAYITITGSSSASNPIKIICVDKATDSLSTGAIVYHNPPNTGYNLRLDKFAYSYGITYKARCNLYVSDNTDTLFVIESGGIHIAYSGSRVRIGSTSVVQLVLINSDITLDNANNYIELYYISQLLWRGGSLVAPNGVTTLFSGSNAYSGSNIEDVDLSALGNNILLNVQKIKNVNAVFSRCKVPSSYTPVTGTWSIGGGSQANLYHCSSANRTYDVYKACYEGTVEDETTIVRTGGASDGTTSLAMKMVSSAGIVEGTGIALTSPPIHAWTSSTTSKTFTIEGIWDSAANIQDDEIWMELEYPANATDGLGAIAKDKCAILGTTADQTASTETWTTTGLTNPNKFKLSVTVTPGKAGPITARVCLAKPSTIVYIDPKITES